MALAQEGLLLRVTHTGLAKVSILLTDVNDGVSDLASFRKAGPVYVPYLETVTLVYAGDVAESFETGAIRQFMTGGYLTAEFEIGSTLATEINNIVIGGPPSGPAGGDLDGTYPNPTVIDLTITNEEQGSILYFDGTNWIQLPPGTSGDVLTTGGTGANPSWTTNGTGDVSGPGSSTDNALVRWDGVTGTLIQDSTGWTLGDTGILDGSSAALILPQGAAPAPTSEGSIAWDSNDDELIIGDGTTQVFILGSSSGVDIGDTLYFDGTRWVRLAPGTAGTFLQTNGVGSAPSWATNAGGDVVGPASSTDNALVRWDGTTGKLIQNSTITLSDVGLLDMSGGSLLLPQSAAPTPTSEGSIAWDTDDDHLVVGDGTGTVTLIDDGTAAGGDLSGTYPNPTVSNLTITGETQGDILYFDGTDWTRFPAGTSGQLLQTNGAGADPEWVDAGSPLTWGNDSVAATTTTRYLSPGFDDGLAQTSPIQFRIPRAGTLQRLRIRHNTTDGNGNAIVYTIRINGVASALTVSLASTSSDGSDLVNTVTVAAGDLLDIEVTKAASVGTSPSDIIASLELV